ncbi:hypothetical protein Droror1_Dr00020125 [Drosera rotundifolia]
MKLSNPPTHLSPSPHPKLPSPHPLQNPILNPPNLIRVMDYLSSNIQSYLLLVLVHPADSVFDNGFSLEGDDAAVGVAEAEAEDGTAGEEVRGDRVEEEVVLVMGGEER